MLERAGVVALSTAGEQPRGTEDVVTQRTWAGEPPGEQSAGRRGTTNTARATSASEGVTPAGGTGAGGTGTVGDNALGIIGGVPVALARISVGAPAAALLLEGAIARGVRNVFVVGSAGSLQRHLPIGTTIVVESAEREDGTSHHYLPAGEVVSADAELSALLEQRIVARGAQPARGRTWTIDAPYRETVGGIARHREAGVSAAEMEAAAIFAVAKVRGIRAALVVAVSDELFDMWNPGFGRATYLEALTRAADAAMDAAISLGRQGG
jgi:uridine phosphorylase